MGKPFGLQRLICVICAISRSLTSRTFTHTEEVTEDASGLVTWVGPAGDVPSLLYIKWDVTHAEFAWVCLL